MNGNWSSFIKNLSYKRTSSLNGWISENENLHNLIDLQDLHEKIKQEINFFAYNVLEIADHISLDIIRSWAVKHTTKDHCQRHLHTNCLLSGIYYLEVTPTSGDIVFDKGGNVNCFQTSFQPDLKKYNAFTSEIITITPQIEDLFIFPSHLYHSVGHNRSNHDRYCLSFDVGMSGYS